MRIWNRFFLLFIYKISGIFYKTPTNFNYWYNFGFLSMFFLLFQIVTGILVSMLYSANTEISFGIALSFTTEFYYGWWFRYLHSNGASFFFITVYIHMARSLFYGSFLYPRQLLWVTGALIWLLMIITAFLGYILPWGQMSYWGAMVITNLLGSIPLIGNDLVFLLWGGFSIGNATLQRFYSLHFMLPFLIFKVTILHLVLLHEYGSNNPLGISVPTDNIPFIPYYGVKDILSLLFIFIFIFIFIFFVPDFLGHPDNYIVANFMITPAHIVPEWYFLPLYAVLRSVPNKLFGIFLILMFILCIFFLPFFNKSIIRSSSFRPFYCVVIFIFIFVCILLGFIGSLPVITPFYEIGQILTFLYFFILIIMLPFLNYLEKIFYKYYIINNKF